MKHLYLRHLSVFFIILKVSKAVVVITEVGTVIENVLINMTTIST